MKDYYKILGVQKNAKIEDIKKNYLRLAQIYHPDKNGGDDKKFKEINEAYQTLSDYWKRQDYDRQNFTNHTSQQSARTESKSNQQVHTEKQEDVKHNQPTDNKPNNTPPKKDYKRVLGIVGFIVFILIVKVVASSSNNKTTSNISVDNQISAPSAQPTSNLFPMNDRGAQFDWYNQHNVAMAYRCYPGGNCSAQDWAYAVYEDKNDTRGVILKQQADNAQTAYVAQFPKEKCVTEHGVKICDLSHSVKKVYGDGTREINFQANAIDCVNVITGSQTQNQGNSVQVDTNDTYCVSDLGAIYIDPTIQVKKYFNKILRDDYNSPYSISDAYETCIWTYADGSATIPYMQVSGNVGPTSGFNVKAFCKNGSNQVDIYSYQEN